MYDSNIYGTAAEWFGAILTGIALIMVVWQVKYEKTAYVKQHHLQMVLEKQNEIMNYNREFLLLTNKHMQLLILHEENNEMKILSDIHTVQTQMSDLVVSMDNMNNMNNISQMLANKLKIKDFKDTSEFTRNLSQGIKKGKGQEILVLTERLTVYNFKISNLCKENVEIIIRLY